MWKGQDYGSLYESHVVIKLLPSVTVLITFGVNLSNLNECPIISIMMGIGLFHLLNFKTLLNYNTIWIVFFEGVAVFTYHEANGRQHDNSGVGIGLMDEINLIFQRLMS